MWKKVEVPGSEIKFFVRAVFSILGKNEKCCEPSICIPGETP